MKYYITTYGCAQNISDSERIVTVLGNLNMTQAEDQHEADFIVYNTCAVKQKAEDRVLGLRREWQRMREKNPKLVIAITGCMVSHGQYKLASMLPEVDIFFNINELPKLPTLLSQHLDIEVAEEAQTSSEDNYFKIQPTSSSEFQGLVSIMTGCNKFCSYCIVPYARGREVSRPPEAIKAEVERIVNTGIKEIMLLGQNVDSYISKNTKGEEVKFADLLYLLDPIPGLERIRYMSPYPTDMTDHVIQAIKELPSVCEHIHLPVQAGSTHMLDAMNRHYTKEQYLSLVEKIRKEIPNVSITTDIIVGFCGETEEDFRDTLELYDVCKFDLAYISMYSERPGTQATKLDDNIPYEEKKRRWELLNTYVKKYSYENNKKYLGRTVEILVETIGRNGKITGKTRTFKIVQCESGVDNSQNPTDNPNIDTAVFDQQNRHIQIGDLINVEITNVTPWALRGKLVS